MVMKIHTWGTTAPRVTNTHTHITNVKVDRNIQRKAKDKVEKTMIERWWKRETRREDDDQLKKRGSKQQTQWRKTQEEEVWTNWQQEVGKNLQGSWWGISHYIKGGMCLVSGLRPPKWPGCGKSPKWNCSKKKECGIWKILPLNVLRWLNQTSPWHLQTRFSCNMIRLQENTLKTQGFGRIMGAGCWHLLVSSSTCLDTPKRKQRSNTKSHTLKTLTKQCLTSFSTFISDFKSK